MDGQATAGKDHPNHGDGRCELFRYPGKSIHHFLASSFGFHGP